MATKKRSEASLKSLLAPLAMLAVLVLVLGLLSEGPDPVSAKIRDSWEQVATSLGVSEGIVESGTGEPSDDPSTLTVAAPGSMNGYARARFGQPWTDDVNVAGGRNGCDTRNDILARDLTGVRTIDGCKVLTGTLADPYTGSVITFQRGKDTSSLVQIDHLVSLGNAWVSGASSWSLPKLKMIANDPLNLAAADGSANTSKGARSADQWLPPNRAFHCTYVKSQVRVKNKYGLTVTAAEKSVMMHFYGRC